MCHVKVLFIYSRKDMTHEFFVCMLIQGSKLLQLHVNVYVSDYGKNNLIFMNTACGCVCV